MEGMPHIDERLLDPEGRVGVVVVTLTPSSQSTLEPWVILRYADGSRAPWQPDQLQEPPEGSE